MPVTRISLFLSLAFLLQHCYMSSNFLWDIGSLDKWTLIIFVGHWSWWVLWKVCWSWGSNVPTAKELDFWLNAAYSDTAVELDLVADVTMEESSIPNFQVFLKRRNRWPSCFVLVARTHLESILRFWDSCQRFSGKRTLFTLTDLDTTHGTHSWWFIAAAANH